MMSEEDDNLQNVHAQDQTETCMYWWTTAENKTCFKTIKYILCISLKADECIY